MLPRRLTLTLLGCALAGVAAPAAAATALPAAQPAPPAAAAAAPIDINRASPAQLQRLPGIGPAEAARIVAGRPYLSKADLASKGVIPAGIYLSIKGRIIALQASRPGATPGHR